MPRVLVVDDHAFIRRGVNSILQSFPEWELCAEAENGQEAVRLADELRPEVIIMDVSMPVLNGIEATKLISRSHPEIKIVLLTLHDSAELLRSGFRAGARGYLLKSDAGRDLVSAIDALRRNKTFFTPKVSQMVLDGYLDKSPKEKQADNEESLRLTSRQREIVQLLAEGKSSKEVAAVLGLSVKTAETHRANIMRKLDCHSVTELVRYAIRNHIIAA